MKTAMQPLIKPLLRRQGGFTLVEMMVALTIGLFMVAGLVSLLVSTSQSRTELDKTSRQIESGRYASQLISEDVQHAGYLGTYSPAIATFTTPPSDPCAIAVANLGFDNTPTAPKVPVFIYGYDGATADATPPSCITNRLTGSGISRTGILVVRRVSTTAIPIGSAVAGETYLQVAACPPITKPFVVSSVAADLNLQQKDCATTGLLHKYIMRVYYVSSCNVCTPASDGIPTLKMVEYVFNTTTSSTEMRVTSLVEGIENLQFDYGIDMDGDGSPDCYISNPTSPATPVPSQITAALCPQPAPAYEWDPAVRAAAVPPLPPHWANVVTVRIYVLARNNETSADWTDTRTYDLGLAGNYTPPAGDKYKRHAYGAVARVVNVAGRRELP